MTPSVAVLIPCHDEEATVGKVVRDFRNALPQAKIYVYDNNSTDRTAEVARGAGAIVRREAGQGKGHVIRRMFRDIDADFFVTVDGDDTYDAGSAAAMLALALDGPYDLVNCVRVQSEPTAFRAGHRRGNAALTEVVRRIFGNRVRDMLSGYKVFSRRFVKSFPVLSHGFDIETELTVHALELSMPVAHVIGPYRGRPEGSDSKLRTYRDGWRILMMIAELIRHERPFAFYGAISALLAIVSVVLAAPLVATYLQTGLVPRLPTALLSTGIMLVAALSWLTALVLDTVTRGRRETRMLAYLQYPPFASNETIAESRMSSGAPDAERHPATGRD
jgi:glycosyltransferase involved in cell wall biosynthesis